MLKKQKRKTLPKMLRSALEINCKSPVRTFLAVLRNPLWSSSAANCSPVATNDVRDKEQQLLDTWLCESIFFQSMPTELWPGCNTKYNFCMSTFLGNLSSGSCWVEAICSFLGFVRGALRRERQRAGSPSLCHAGLIQGCSELLFPALCWSFTLLP